MTAPAESAVHPPVPAVLCLEKFFISVPIPTCSQVSRRCQPVNRFPQPPPVSTRDWQQSLLYQNNHTVIPVLSGSIVSYSRGSPGAGKAHLDPAVYYGCVWNHTGRSQGVFSDRQEEGPIEGHFWQVLSSSTYSSAVNLFGSPRGCNRVLRFSAADNSQSGC